MKKNINFIYKITLLIIILNIKTSSITNSFININFNNNKNINVSIMNKVINNFKKNDIDIPIKSTSGILTAYTANCPECSGKLGCNNLNVLDGTTKFNDKLYGEVNIVASSPNLACGSIIRFENENNDNITAIVLDRGVSGNAIDLLVENHNLAIKKGRKKINYDILRIGWDRN